MDGNRILLCALVCALFAVIITCGCMNGDDPVPTGLSPDDGPPSGNMSGQRPEITSEAFEAQVAELEALGFDLSEVRAAIDAGDQAAAQEAFRQFTLEHRDELPESYPGRPQPEGARAPPVV